MKMQRLDMKRPEIKQIDAQQDCCSRYYFFGKHTAKCMKINKLTLEEDINVPQEQPTTNNQGS
jgi:hypothetical protein